MGSMECMEIFPRWKKGVFLTRGHSPLTIRPMIAKQLTPELGEKKTSQANRIFPGQWLRGPTKINWTIVHSVQNLQFTLISFPYVPSGILFAPVSSWKKRSTPPRHRSSQHKWWLWHTNVRLEGPSPKMRQVGVVTAVKIWIWNYKSDQSGTFEV